MKHLLFVAVLAAPLSASAQTISNSPLPCSQSDQVGDLGFNGLECVRCTITGKHVAGKADITFDTEPVLSSIVRGGPADGKLEERDVLVALDGQLITTSAAAVHYSWLEVGKPVRVTVRRAGILKEIDITPRGRCRPLTQDFFPTFRTTSKDMKLFPLTNLKARGWLGVGLSLPLGGVEWTTPISFATFPEVADVTPDSPAAKAGVRKGDVLIAINGVSLRTRDGTTLFRTVQPGQQVTLLVIRDASALTLTITATAR